VKEPKDEFPKNPHHNLRTHPILPRIIINKAFVKFIKSLIIIIKLSDEKIVIG
jgi:hypothetical protein